MWTSINEKTRWRNPKWVLKVEFKISSLALLSCLLQTSFEPSAMWAVSVFVVEVVLLPAQAKCSSCFFFFPFFFNLLIYQRNWAMHKWPLMISFCHRMHPHLYQFNLPRFSTIMSLNDKDNISTSFTRLMMYLYRHILSDIEFITSWGSFLMIIHWSFLWIAIAIVFWIAKNSTNRTGKSPLCFSFVVMIWDLFSLVRYPTEVDPV